MQVINGVRIDPMIPEPLRCNIVACLASAEAVDLRGMPIDLVWETSERLDASNPHAIIRLLSAETLASYSELTLCLAAGEVPIPVSAEPADVVETIALRRRGLIAISEGVLLSLAANDRYRLTQSESRLLAELEIGGTLAEIAERIHYTGRHVTRLWRSLRLKSGTNDRGKVIEFFQNREKV